MLVPVKEDRVLLLLSVVQAMAAGGVGFIRHQHTASKATDRILEFFIVGMWQYDCRAMQPRRKDCFQQKKIVRKKPKQLLSHDHG
jgi:hypothetical protein